MHDETVATVADESEIVERRRSEPENPDHTEFKAQKVFLFTIENGTRGTLRERTSTINPGFLRVTQTQMGESDLIWVGMLSLLLVTRNSAGFQRRFVANPRTLWASE